jgi:hypothetical protein
MSLPLDGKPHPDAPPQSKTWHCRPEPHIVRLHWTNGQSFELLRLVHQTFSILKWTDPNSGHVSANFTYAGTVIPSGEAKTTYANYCELDFSLNAVGGGLIKEFYYFAPMVNNCHDISFPWHFSRSFDPGQFDLVGGASWTFYYAGVEPC